VAGLCPTVEDADECAEKLPGFWAELGKMLWTGYFDPQADWMCAPMCADPVEGDLTCDDCKRGIQAGIDQLLSEEAINQVVDAFSGEVFCGKYDDERCPDAVDFVIRQGLPLLAQESENADFGGMCNIAVEGTCPSKWAKLF